MNEQQYNIPEEELERERTKEETDKKCPSCGGTIDFDPGTGGLACPYCGYTAEIAATGSAEELDFLTAEHTGNFDWGTEKKSILCKSCGAESVYDALQLSNECPYCGSNQVMEEKGKRSLAPGGVCVFKLNAQQAGENFRTWIRKKWFCPRVAKQKAKPESFSGVYLPYWTFDTQTHTQYTASYGIDRTRHTSDGKTETITDWYRTAGNYEEFIDDQLTMGSTRHEPGMMRRIEPFNTADNVSYKPEYVAGFISERYSIGLKDAWEAAKSAIKSRLESNITHKIKREKHADHVRSLNISTNYSNIKFKYLLLPVWLSSFAYKQKIYQFMVNGQTGKVGGKAPVSALRVMIAVAVGLALLVLLYQILSQA